MRECTPFAAFKRCIEYFEADPDFRAAFLADGRKAAADLGFGDLPDADAAVEAVRQVCIEGIGTLDERSQAANPYLKAYLEMTDTVSETVCRNHAES